MAISLKTMAELSNIFPTFYNIIKKQFGIGFKRVISDNAKDFFNQSLSVFFQ